MSELLDAYGQELPPRRKPFLDGLRAIALILAPAIGAGALGYGLGRDSAKQHTFTWGQASVINFQPYDEDPKNEITAGPHYEALVFSYSAWKKAIGKVPPMPRLFMGSAGDCSFSTGVIACAKVDKNEIVIVSTESIKMRTILMHEIGHLLGVPHIQGDDLMNASYTKDVERPTRFAVALAKIAGTK